GQNGHAEVLVRVAGRDFAQVEELLAGEAEFGVVGAEVALDDVGVEGVIAGGDGGVGGEDVGGRDEFEGFVEGKFLFFHEHVNAFNGEKGGVALVHVADGGFVFQGSQGAHAADAQKNFLPDAHVLVATVK